MSILVYLLYWLTLVPTNPLDQEWEYVYDPRGRKLEEIAPKAPNAHGHLEHPFTDWVYDGVGNVLSVVDPEGHYTETVYDAARRPVFTVLPETEVMLSGGTTATLHPVTYNQYDEAGNVLAVIQGGIDAVTSLPAVEELGISDVGTALTEPQSSAANTYDALGRLLTTSTPITEPTLGEPDGSTWMTVTNGYDAVGNRTDVWDGQSQHTQFEYDGLARNTKVIDAASVATEMRYDRAYLRQRHDSLAQETNYTYDPRNRLHLADYDSSAPSDADRTYVYDFVGNILSVTEDGKSGQADVAYTYDRLNRVVSETSVGLEHNYGYDLAGNRLKTVYAVGATDEREITSTYDALNRLSTMTEGGRATHYEYDLNGKVVRKTLPNGEIIATRYDALGRVTDLNPYPEGTGLYRFHYIYDLSGNARQIVENYPGGSVPNRTVTNVYDKSQRLVTETVQNAGSEVVTGYTYDKANNRTARTVTVDGGTAATTVYVYGNSLNQLDAYFEDADNDGTWDSGETGFNFE